ASRLDRAPLARLVARLILREPRVDRRELARDSFAPRQEVSDADLDRAHVIEPRLVNGKVDALEGPEHTEVVQGAEPVERELCVQLPQLASLLVEDDRPDAIGR